jgi:hypothetical protein
MTIKYGELTKIYNKQQSNIFAFFLKRFSYETYPPTKSKFVFLFEDGEICDADDKLNDFKFKFFNSIFHNTPRYFEKSKEKGVNNVYFHKEVNQNDNGQKMLNVRQLFDSYTKYNYSTSIPSSYNCVYYCYKSNLKPEIFGILRIKSSETMPRFLFAYDSDEFTKEEVIYLIHYILNPLERQNEDK